MRSCITSHPPERARIEQSLGLKGFNWDNGPFKQAQKALGTRAKVLDASENCLYVGAVADGAAAGLVGLSAVGVTQAGMVPLVGAFSTANLVGSQAIVAARLPAGIYTALVVNGKVYVARFHHEAWRLAGRKGIEQFYGIAEIDATGKVLRLFK